MEIKKRSTRTKLDITPVLVKEYTATLKNLGVDSVPTLFVNGRYEKLILNGKEAIRRYLTACQSPGSATPFPAGRPRHQKGIRQKIRRSRIAIAVIASFPLEHPESIVQPCPGRGRL